MIARIVELSLVQRVMVCTLGFLLFFGGLYAFHTLDIVAYPDPSPPMVELITQQPGWSAEEIERQITIPIEVALNGMPGLTDIRSLSIFGLSDIKVYFDFNTEVFRDRQEVLNRLGSVQLPPGAAPSLSPWWAIAEIYRYELTGAGETTLTDLKTIQDWQVRREFRRIPGVIDVTAFGGTTKEYHVDIDPGRLISYGVNLSQVMSALTNSNANVGGNYLTIGAQNYNIRGLGLINGIADIENVMVAEKRGRRFSSRRWELSPWVRGSVLARSASMIATMSSKASFCSSGVTRRSMSLRRFEGKLRTSIPGSCRPGSRSKLSTTAQP